MSELTYGVMQVTETRETFCVFLGSEEECEGWLEENSEQYPESKFYLEIM